MEAEVGRVNLDKFKGKLIKCAMHMEFGIALCIVLAILLGLVILFKYLAIIAVSDIEGIYNIFKAFLSIALLLVIGVEMVLMLLTHSSRSILELVLFAIARKMLVYSETMLDLILGTIAIAIVFIIQKYLVPANSTLEKGQLNVDMHTIQDEYEYSDGMIEDKEMLTDRLISHLYEESGTPLREGAEYSTGNIYMKIMKLKDGTIEKIKFKEKKQSKERG
ncbi:hypothetical protein [Alkaliphilus crotonatoxidans]